MGSGMDISLTFRLRSLAGPGDIETPGVVDSRVAVSVVTRNILPPPRDAWTNGKASLLTLARSV